MKPPYSHPERVPVSAVTRLQRNLAELITALDTVLASTDCADSAVPRLQRAAALLRQEEANLQVEADAFQQNREPLVRRAADLRLLAQRMNGYTPTSLPDESLKALFEKRQLLVLTSWQIAAAASGSEAAGL